MAKNDPFSARSTLSTSAGTLAMYRLAKLEEAGLTQVDRLPYSVRVLLESVLRTCDGYVVSEQDVKNVAGWAGNCGVPGVGESPVEIPFTPARVVLQDFTGVPCVVDLAAMRSAMRRLGGDPKKINPLAPVDLVIDHSVQVDHYLGVGSLDLNIELEFQRNQERYEFLRWGQQAFNNFRVVPPGTGIVHQVNLEYLAKCVFVRDGVALPDSLVGTDSHTTMIDGLGVVGWGVGGIEAEAVMLGQPIYMLMPEVVGMELTGKLPPGATATDMVLTVTEVLRKEKVVGKFVEFFGEGIDGMSVADRATIANMSPEYGATMGFFAVDDQTLLYLRQTGRTAQEVDLVERYCKENQLFRTASAPIPTFTKTLRLDLGTVEPCLAGPKRPQDRVPLVKMKESFRAALRAPIADRGFELSEESIAKQVTVTGLANGSAGGAKDAGVQITHGAVTIAAITSCTNTSNPSVMLAAGLVAKKAAALGLKAKPYVKTSLAPGSRVVTDYLAKSGLDKELEKVGFFTVGYGCTTCIGNSGPLPEPVAKAVVEGNLVVSGVLSGNRNFEGRINPHVKANYLASPPLVVAYALAGTTDIDLATEPLGQGPAGPVFLKDIWPTHAEVQGVVQSCVLPEMFQQQYDNVWAKNPNWNALPVTGGELYDWDDDSTYIQEPPFLAELTVDVSPIRPLAGAKCLALLGDSVTTDHISPAGSIAKNSPAGKFLIDAKVDPADFNSYGARRGNDRVMTRGTFANIRIRNAMTPGVEGGVTRYLPTKPGASGAGEVVPIYDAAQLYKKDGTPLVVVAGAEYGTGSSRDWAAKGTFLLGVRAVLAVSYERIHRSNLVMMGVLPLQFEEGTTAQLLGLTGEETFGIPDLGDTLQPLQTITVHAGEKKFPMKVRIDTPVELDYYRHGGILPYVVRKLLAD